MKRRKVDTEHRVIAHIDLDCFYVQVERSLNPSLKGIPVAVVQYDPFGDLRSLGPTDNRIIRKGGGIIAVSYEARAKGVKRNVRGGEAKHSCPELVLVQVPTSHGKADLTIYREASAKIVSVLGSRYSNCIVERASIDEVYLDVTSEAISMLATSTVEQLQQYIEELINVPTTIAGEDSQEIHLSRSELSRGHEGTSENMKEGEIRSVWFSRPIEEWSIDDKLLLCGSKIICNLRKDVFSQLGFTCSGGIANNKMLAKLASGMHKPNKQTIVPDSVIADVMRSLPLSRIQGLGGKLGKAIRQEFGDRITTMGDILLIDKNELIEKFGEESTQWMINAANGIDREAVQDRTLVISIGCSKSYVSSNMLTPDNMTDGVILKWFTELAEELVDRVRADTAANSRMPKNLTIGLGVTPYNETDEIEKEEIRKMLNSTMGAQARRNEISSTFSVVKTVPMIPSASAELIAKTALTVAQRALTEHPKMLTPSLQQGMFRITGLSLGANNFIDVAVGSKAISSFFKAGGASDSSTDCSSLFDRVSVNSVAPSVGSKRILPVEEVTSVKGISSFMKNGTDSKLDLFDKPMNRVLFEKPVKLEESKVSPVKSNISSFFNIKSSSSSKDWFGNSTNFPSTNIKRNDREEHSISKFFSKVKNVDDDSFIDLTTFSDDDEISSEPVASTFLPSSFKDIDPEVFSSLPADIQRELINSLSDKK